MPNPDNQPTFDPYSLPDNNGKRRGDPGYRDGDGMWRGVSWILDPAGVGGQGGVGNTNVWGQIAGTTPGWQTMQAPQIYGPGGSGAPGAPGTIGPATAGGVGSGTAGMQASLIQQLQDQAAGRGPSLAQMQLQKGGDAAMRQAMALGQSTRGTGAGGTMKSILGRQAGIAQGMAGDAGMLALQEQMAARGALGQQLNQQAGLEQNNSQFNATQQQQAAQFNTTTGLTAAQQQQEAAIAQAKLNMEMERLRSENAKQNSPAGMVGGILSAFSDERLKTDVKSGDSKIYSFLDALGSHDYKYKDAKHGEGRRVSPMAQELEKTELGEEFVFETPDGKAVDYGKGFGTLLAAQAALHKRLKAAGI